MTKKMKTMIFLIVVLGTLSIAGASVLGVDEFLKLFSGISDVVQIIE